MFLRKMVHTKCINAIYPLSNVQRFNLENSEVPWDVNIVGYSPPFYESKSILNKPWADPDIGSSFNPHWNAIDGKINRKSYDGIYNIIEGRPQNHKGRTGLVGRGLLGRWGPNHAADPIVTRWKLANNEKVLNIISNLPILQFCAIQRRDCNEWAIPGGMVDPGETVSETLKREFSEEALNSLEKHSNDVEKGKAMIAEFFKSGLEIYKGYVDDPRNTDNAWMETVAINFHDDTGDYVGKFALEAGDDAKNVRWMDIHNKSALYASHSDFIQRVATIRNAHW